MALIYRLSIIAPYEYGTKETVTMGGDYADPMQALRTISQDFINRNGFASCQRVECHTYDGDTKLERQWCLTID